MSGLDGNAIAGALHEAFGAEMTTAATVCGSCRAARPVAELVVYLDAPGIVARCRSCSAVLVVLVPGRTHLCVDLWGLQRLDSPA